MTVSGNHNDQSGILRPGWILVWTLSVAQLISWGSLYYAFAVYALPMEREFGWSKAEVNGALSLGLLVSGLAALPVGAWIDRKGGRAVMVLGSLVGGLLLLIWSQTTDLMVFYAVWAAMGLALASVLYEPAFAVLTANLGPNYRRAITVVTLLGGLASTVFIPLTQWLVEILGWRNSLIVLAAFNLIVCAGIHAVFLKGTRPGLAPKAMANSDIDVATEASNGRSPLRRALMTPCFWGLLIGFSGHALVASALIFHFIPMQVERGMAIGTIVALMALIGPMQVLGRLILLALGPCLSARQIGRMAVLFLPASILALAAMPATPISAALFMVLYGVSNGMLTIVRGTIVPEVLGSTGYATINGAISFPANMLKAVAPTAAAVIWMWGGGYDVVLWVLFALYAGSAVALWLATGGHQDASAADRPIA